MVTKSKNLKAIVSCLAGIKTIELEGKDIKHLVQLNKHINSESETLHESQKKVFDDYGVSVGDQGLYSWNGHEKQEEITTKMNELMDIDIVLSPTNFLDEDVFYASTKGMSIAEIVLIEPILLKLVES